MIRELRYTAYLYGCTGRRNLEVTGDIVVGYDDIFKAIRKDLLGKRETEDDAFGIRLLLERIGTKRPIANRDYLLSKGSVEVIIGYHGADEPHREFINYFVRGEERKIMRFVKDRVLPIPK